MSRLLRRLEDWECNTPWVDFDFCVHFVIFTSVVFLAGMAGGAAFTLLEWAIRG